MLCRISDSHYFSATKKKSYLNNSSVFLEINSVVKIAAGFKARCFYCANFKLSASCLFSKKSLASASEKKAFTSRPDIREKLL